MKRVTDSAATLVTVTAKLQAALCPAVSAPVHATLVAPGENNAPLPGVQVTVTLPLPPLPDGNANVTGTGWPPAEVTSVFGGQSRVNGGGAVGDPPHPADVRSASTATL
jgi:hypothetical protein